jgi:hypothetical protein
MLGEKANISKAQNLSGKHRRKSGRHKREGECDIETNIEFVRMSCPVIEIGCALPGEVSLLACTATTAERQ